MNKYNSYAQAGRNGNLLTHQMDDAAGLLDDLYTRCGLSNTKRIEQAAALAAACEMSPSCSTR